MKDTIHAAAPFGSKRTQCGLTSLEVLTRTRKDEVECKTCIRVFYDYWN